MLESCETTPFCDWVNVKPDHAELAGGRWYSTNQLLPNGSMIIVGGRDFASIEYVYPRPKSGIIVNFPFLAKVADSQMHNLCRDVHLLPNGHLFVFANNISESILYDYSNNVVLKQYPEFDGGPRNRINMGSPC